MQIGSKKYDYLYFLAQIEPMIQIFFVILHRFYHFTYGNDS